MAEDYPDVKVLAVSSNDAERYPRDSYDAMRERVAADGGWPMPYLYDESQEVARAYDAKTTPDCFLIDAEGRIVYRGAPDADYQDPSLKARLAARGDRRRAGRRRSRAGRDRAGGLLDQVEAVIDAGDDARRARRHHDRQQQRLVARGVDAREGAPPDRVAGDDAHQRRGERAPVDLDVGGWRAPAPARPRR